MCILPSFQRILPKPGTVYVIQSRTYLDRYFEFQRKVIKYIRSNEKERGTILVYSAQNDLALRMAQGMLLCTIGVPLYGIYKSFEPIFKGEKEIYQTSKFSIKDSTELFSMSL